MGEPQRLMKLMDVIHERAATCERGMMIEPVVFPDGVGFGVGVVAPNSLMCAMVFPALAETYDFCLN